MTAFITRCCKRLEAGLLALLLLAACAVHAGSIEPKRAALTPGDTASLPLLEVSSELGDQHLTLAAMVAERPQSLAEFARLSGVGEHKLERYGEAFLAVIREAP